MPSKLAAAAAEASHTYNSTTVFVSLLLCCCELRNRTPTPNHNTEFRLGGFELAGSWVLLKFKAYALGSGVY